MLHVSGACLHSLAECVLLFNKLLFACEFFLDQSQEPSPGFEVSPTWQGALPGLDFPTLMSRQMGGLSGLHHSCLQFPLTDHPASAPVLCHQPTESLQRWPWASGPFSSGGSYCCLKMNTSRRPLPWWEVCIFEKPKPLNRVLTQNPGTGLSS